MLITARQRSCGKIMFSHVSVCLILLRGGGTHVTITHDELDLTVQDPQPPC